MRVFQVVVMTLVAMAAIAHWADGEGWAAAWAALTAVGLFILYGKEQGWDDWE